MNTLTGGLSVAQNNNALLRHESSGNSSFRAHASINNGTLANSKRDYYSLLRATTHPRLSSRSSQTQLNSWTAPLTRSISMAGDRMASDDRPSSSMATRRAESLQMIKGNAFCGVTMLDGQEVEFQINKKAKAYDLFKLVCQFLDLVEHEYFGLIYRDPSCGVWFWLALDKKICDQMNTSPWRVDFQVKFYPKEPSQFKEALTRYYLCLQVRQDIVSGKLPCSFNTLVLLGAYVVQSEVGDFEEDKAKLSHVVSQMPLAPARAQTGELVAHILDQHRLLKGEPPEVMDSAFLDNAKKLAMYGIDLQRATEMGKKQAVMVGVYHTGIVIYRGQLRINRIIWAKIIRLTRVKGQFHITLRGVEGASDEQTIKLKCSDSRCAKKIWQLCKDHHSFFRLEKSPVPRRAPLLLGLERFRVSRTTLHQMHNLEYRAQLGRTDSYHQMTGIHQSVMRKKHGDSGNMVFDWSSCKSGVDVSSRHSNPLSCGGGDAGVSGSSTGGLIEDAMSGRPKLPSAQWRVSGVDRSKGLMIDTESGLAVATAVAAAGDKDWLGCRTNWGVTGRSVRVYYEATVMGQGPVLLGWACNNACFHLGMDRLGFGYGTWPEESRLQAGPRRTHDKLDDGRGIKVHAGVVSSYGELVVSGDVIGCFLDLGHGKVSWTRNGRELGCGFQLADSLKHEAFFPACAVKDSSVVFNFGVTDLSYLPRSGWTPISQSELSSLVANRNQGWRLNPHDITDGVTLAPDCLVTQAAFNRGKQCVRATKGVRNHGRFYYEVTALETPCLCVVGWSCEEASLDLGSDRLGFGFGSFHPNVRPGSVGPALHGRKVNAEDREETAEVICVGDVIGCLLDLDASTVAWTKNGGKFGPVYRMRPELRGQTFYPTVAFLETTLHFNFGDFPFKNMPEGPWIGVSTAPETVVFQSKRTGSEKKGWTCNIDSELLDMRQRPKKERHSTGWTLPHLTHHSSFSSALLASQEDTSTINEESSVDLTPPGNNPPNVKNSFNKAMKTRENVAVSSSGLVKSINNESKVSHPVSPVNITGTIPTVHTHVVRYGPRDTNANDVITTTTIPIVPTSSVFYRPPSSPPTITTAFRSIHHATVISKRHAQPSLDSSYLPPLSITRDHSISSSHSPLSSSLNPNLSPKQDPFSGKDHWSDLPDPTLNQTDVNEHNLLLPVDGQSNSLYSEICRDLIENKFQLPRKSVVSTPSTSSSRTLDNFPPTTEPSPAPLCKQLSQEIVDLPDSSYSLSKVESNSYDREHALTNSKIHSNDVTRLTSESETCVSHQNGLKLKLEVQSSVPVNTHEIISSRPKEVTNISYPYNHNKTTDSFHTTSNSVTMYEVRTNQQHHHLESNNFEEHRNGSKYNTIELPNSNSVKQVHSNRASFDQNFATEGFTPSSNVCHITSGKSSVDATDELISIHVNDLKRTSLQDCSISKHVTQTTSNNDPDNQSSQENGSTGQIRLQEELSSLISTLNVNEINAYKCLHIDQIPFLDTEDEMKSEVDCIHKDESPVGNLQTENEKLSHVPLVGNVQHVSETDSQKTSSTCSKSLVQLSPSKQVTNLTPLVLKLSDQDPTSDSYIESNQESKIMYPSISPTIKLNDIKIALDKEHLEKSRLRSVSDNETIQQQTFIDYEFNQYRAPCSSSHSCDKSSYSIDVDEPDLPISNPHQSPSLLESRLGAQASTSFIESDYPDTKRVKSPTTRGDQGKYFFKSDYDISIAHTVQKKQIHSASQINQQVSPPPPSHHQHKTHDIVSQHQLSAADTPHQRVTSYLEENRLDSSQNVEKEAWPQMAQLFTQLERASRSTSESSTTRLLSRRLEIQTTPRLNFYMQMSPARSQKASSSLNTPSPSNPHTSSHSPDSPQSIQMCSPENLSSPTVANYIPPEDTFDDTFSAAIIAVTGIDPEAIVQDSLQMEDLNSQLRNNGWFQYEV